MSRRKGEYKRNRGCPTLTSRCLRGRVGILGCPRPPATDDPTTNSPQRLQSFFVKTERIATLLRPFLKRDLRPPQLDQISTYIDLLLRWNQRVNLTAVCDPEEIVTRHFGESLFAARHLFPRCPDGQGLADDRRPFPACPALSEATGDTLPLDQPPAADDSVAPENRAPLRLVDIGSGAGFPGLPIKIWSPQTPITLIESRQKKVAFLREVIRALTLTDIDVFAGRAEDFPPDAAGIVILRAVERFDHVLPVAAARLTPGGTLALLISQPQAQIASRLPRFQWQPSAPIPHSSSRALLVGYKIS